MKKQCLIIALVVCVASFALAQDSVQIHALRPFNPSQNAPQATTISYNGGPVFETTPNVYIIYYGKFTKKDRKVVNGYFVRLGGSNMNQINTTYSDSSNTFVPNTIGFTTANVYKDPYSLGKNLSDASLRTIIANAIKNGHLPNDTNGIYFVLTSTDVSLGGFCTQFCGYHGPATNIVTGETIKYSFVGNPAKCPSGCEASAVLNDNGSPNDDPGADGMINIMWHEFSETVTDPLVNMQTAWASNVCGENGDCCAWNFGNVFNAPNGHKATNQIGNKFYVAQTMLELNSKTRGQNIPGTCRNTFQ